MRRPLGLLLLLVPLGCAPTMNVARIAPAHTARLAPEVLQKLDAADAAKRQESDRELELARQHVASSQKAWVAVKSEAVTDEIAEVHSAKIARAACELSWQESLLRSAEWRRSWITSSGELAKAETLSRAGDDIDVAHWAAQQDRMRIGLANAVRQQNATRARFDDAERRLAEAKARYARARADR